MRTLTRGLLALTLWIAVPSVALAQNGGATQDLQFSQSLTAPGTVIITTNGQATVSVVATGSGSGLTFTFQGTNDGTTWTTLPGTVPSTGASATSFSANGTWLVSAAGFQTVRVNLTAISGGTEAFALAASARTNGSASSGGGGGGDATAANQALQITQETLTNTTLGTTASAAATAGSIGDVSAKLRLMTTQLDSILTAVGSAIPACTGTPNCTANIGNVFTPSNVTPNECGGTRAGSASDAYGASSTKHGFTLQNISDVAMWVRFTGTAAPSGINSFLLNSGQIASSVAGGSVFMPVGFNTALSVYGTGDFSCVWW